MPESRQDKYLNYLVVYLIHKAVLLSYSTGINRAVISFKLFDLTSTGSRVRAKFV